MWKANTELAKVIRQGLPSARGSERPRHGRLGASRFRPGLVPSLTVLAGLVVLLGLGSWQLERLAWKEGLIAERQARLALPPAPLPVSAGDWAAWDLRRVVVVGEFRHDLEQRFGASTHQERLGQHVLTPLVRPLGPAVLVDRGWVPTDRADPAARRAGQIEGPVEIQGVARFRAADRPGWFTPANQPAERLWYGYDLAALERALGLELLPIVVEADASPNPGGLPIGGVGEETTLPNHHLQYAFTWYALAVGLIGVYVVFGLQRGREAP